MIRILSGFWLKSTFFWWYLRSSPFVKFHAFMAYIFHHPRSFNYYVVRARRVCIPWVGPLVLYCFVALAKRVSCWKWVFTKPRPAGRPRAVASQNYRFRTVIFRIFVRRFDRLKLKWSEFWVVFGWNQLLCRDTFDHPRSFNYYMVLARSS